MRELIVDNFAGGGGASTGIELATGRDVDIAINHDEAAILMHKTNHPSTVHYCENVWDVDPRKATKGQPVGLAWFSPDCKHFSKAKGGKPAMSKQMSLIEEGAGRAHCLHDSKYPCTHYWASQTMAACGDGICQANCCMKCKDKMCGYACNASRSLIRR